jgi:hypothetical protein
VSWPLLAGAKPQVWEGALSQTPTSVSRHSRSTCCGTMARSWQRLGGDSVDGDVGARSVPQARKIRMRLGDGVDLLAPFPAPKGMHRRTFQRLRARAEAALFGSNPSAR